MANSIKSFTGIKKAAINLRLVVQMQCNGILQRRIQDFLKGGFDTLSRAKNLEATPIFLLKPRPFSIV